jgi:hypothetical protein
MKSVEQIDELMSSPYKDIEKELGIQIRNGQAVEGIKKALLWVKQ